MKLKKSISISFFIDLWQNSSFEKRQKLYDPYFVMEINPNSRLRISKLVVKSGHQNASQMRNRPPPMLEWLSFVCSCAPWPNSENLFHSVDIISPSWKTEDRRVLCVWIILLCGGFKSVILLSVWTSYRRVTFSKWSIV